MSIKSNPPKQRNIANKGRQTKQGYYTPRNPDKYIGDLSKIIYRSSWELIFMNYVDTNDKVVAWTSEPEPGIPYYDKITQKSRIYYPDFLMRVAIGEDEKSGKIQVHDYLVEIKPKKEYPHRLSNGQLYQPKPTKTKTGRITEKRQEQYNRELKTYLLNSYKMKAAQAFCNENNKTYLVIDEDWIDKQKQM